MSTFHRELGDLADPFSNITPVVVDGLELGLLVEALRKMFLIRKAEIAIADLYEAGETRTPCHLAIGQEGVAAGVCAMLNADDALYGTHRSHSQFLAMDCPVDQLIAEVMGKETGCSKGFGGSMHLTGVEYGFGGSVPIVGGTISIAVGAAFAKKLDGGSSVGVCFFGDGATEEGTFHESLNLAALYKAPAIFVCENNLYSSHMDVVDRQLSDRMARFAEAHKVNTEVVDGNNVPEVMRAMSRLLEVSRNGGGPGFLEAVTYRWRGHVGPDENIDVGVRRSEQDVQAWKKRDPIARLESALIAAELISASDARKMEAKVDQEIASAIDAARLAVAPSAELLLGLVYAGGQS